MKRLMLVDDERSLTQALRRVLSRALKDDGVVIEAFDDPREALQRAEEVPFAVVLSDYRMPPMDGVTFLKRFREIQPDALRLILSATTDFDTVMAAVNQAEIHRYLVKPWVDEELVATVRTALARFDEVADDRRLADEMRLQQGSLTPEELEIRRLEAEEPGITKVKWGPDGSVILDDDE